MVRCGCMFRSNALKAVHPPFCAGGLVCMCVAGHRSASASRTVERGAGMPCAPALHQPQVPALCALDWLALRGRAGAAIHHRPQSGAIGRNKSQSAVCRLSQGPRCPLPPLPLPRRPWRPWWPARELAGTLAAQIYFRPSASSAFRTAGRSRMRRYQALRCSRPSKRMPAL